MQSCREEVVRLYKSWDTADWNELDWGKVKDLQARDVLDERRKQAERAQNRICITCEKFVKHVSGLQQCRAIEAANYRQFAMRHDEWIIKENISQIRQLMSDQNLQLLPDYEQRIAVLKDLDFIDEKTRVQLKGKVACEVRLIDELIQTESTTHYILLDPFCGRACPN